MRGVRLSRINTGVRIEKNVDFSFPTMVGRTEIWGVIGLGPWDALDPMWNLNPCSLCAAGRAVANPGPEQVPMARPVILLGGLIVNLAAQADIPVQTPFS